eukprot:SAG31_NODE_17837_length_656_cov_1.005386_1_plen_88_part_00
MAKSPRSSGTRPVVAAALLIAVNGVLTASEEEPGACPVHFGHQLAGPALGCSDAVRAEWLQHLKACRTKALADINYSGGVFDNPQVI